MKIKEIFTKDIFRPINGVIKADQKDDISVWQELDEFVVTDELTGHFDKFFGVYKEALDHPKHPDAAGKIGVWISGFFGSGKSHFLKELYYLLANVSVKKDGVAQTALQFFEKNVKDAMLLGTVKKVIGTHAEAILFNIDSKAEQAKGKDAILTVFLKVLNELQDFSPDHPHIAHIERLLEKNDSLAIFQKKYKDLTGKEWVDQRVSWSFNHDEIVKSLAFALKQSEKACEKLLDHAETDFSLTVENFAKWVKEYLDKKGPNHHLFFLVDEIGQFIGQDGHLMLNLQTIVENLGTICQGRAWVIVTSQEDIDTVVGVLNQQRRNDFSKITGRFKTRLSLSSANVDEVIKRRLLDKQEKYIPKLKQIYSPNADILKNQLMFSADTGMSLTAFRDADDFAATYPFIPYQFKLIQKVFETIRRAGATGLHLARGERSMLDAFQDAAKSWSDKECDVLVPLYAFYPSIESFLDTSVKKTITQAKANKTLQAYDISILQTLFMIRYIDELKGNVDNLVTLFIDAIDADRLAIRKKIEQSLARLEKETLVGRKGDEYYFLTNEEQDISREIKAVELGSGDESRELSKMIYEDIYKDSRKHRYAKTGKDFDLIQLLDMTPHGGRLEKGLMISIVSQFYEDYELFDSHRCIQESTKENGSILIKLPESTGLNQEILEYLKTEKYISRKLDVNVEVKRILDERKSDNRLRKTRLLEVVRQMLADAKVYINGQNWEDGSQDPMTIRFKALDYLVDNTFSKMGYIEHPCDDPRGEIKALLSHDDTTQTAFDLTIPQNNPKAIKDIRDFIHLTSASNHEIILGDLVERYANRHFGWSEWETLLLVVKLVCVGEIQFVFSGTLLETKQVNEKVEKTSNWKKITIRQRQLVDPGRIEEVRKLGQLLFGIMGPDKELQLYDHLREKLENWEDLMNGWRGLAETGKYPGLREIEELLRVIGLLLEADDSYEFMNRFIENRDSLMSVSKDFADINTFYTKQRLQWDEFCSALERFEANRLDLEKNEGASRALVRMREIRNAPAPYGIIKETSDLIRIVEKINEECLKTARGEVKNQIDYLVKDLEREANVNQVSEVDFNASKSVLDELNEHVENETNVSNIRQFKEEAKTVFDTEITKLTKKKANPPKEVITITVKSLSKKTYFETEKEVDDFVGELSDAFKKALKDGKRIRVE